MDAHERDFSDPSTPVYLSYSSLQKFQQCRRQWRYHYALRLRPRSDAREANFDLGTITGQILERVLPPGPMPAASEAGRLREFAFDVALDLGARVHGSARPERVVRLAATAAGYLAAAVVSRSLFEGSTIEAVERQTEVAIPGCPNAYVSAKPDLEIRLANGRLWIPDYKTKSATPPTHRANPKPLPRRFDRNLQAHVYAYVLAQGERLQPQCENLIAWLGPKAKPLAEPVIGWVDTTPGDGTGEGFVNALAETELLLRDVVRQIRAGAFSPTFDHYGSACGQCATRDLCNLEIAGNTAGTADEIERIRRPSEALDVGDLSDIL